MQPRPHTRPDQQGDEDDVVHMAHHVQGPTNPRRKTYVLPSLAYLTPSPVINLIKRAVCHGLRAAQEH